MAQGLDIMYGFLFSRLFQVHSFLMCCEISDKEKEKRKKKILEHHKNKQGPHFILFTGMERDVLESLYEQWQRWYSDLLLFFSLVLPLFVLTS